MCAVGRVRNFAGGDLCNNAHAARWPGTGRLGGPGRQRAAGSAGDDAVAYRLLPGADSLAMQLVRYAAALPLSLAAALASWNLYEKHFLRLKRYFHSEKSPAGAAATSANR